MADFCKPCSIKMFGRDFGDIRAGVVGAAAVGLCEGCGFYIVADHEGNVMERHPLSEDGPEDTK